MAIIVGSIGVLIAVAGVWAFKQAKTTTNPVRPNAATSLVTSGIFRFTRNPMYLGLACLLITQAIYLSSPMSLIGVAGFIGYINQFQIKPEERAIGVIFGEEYVIYKSQVRRWL